MKLFVATLLGAALAAGAASAQQSPYYVAGNIGANLNGDSDVAANVVGVGSIAGEVDHDTGLFVSGAVGRNVGGPLSVEAEFLYLQHDLDRGQVGAESDLEAWGLMANAKLEYFKEGPLSPYFGAGVGYAQTKYSLLGESEDDGGVAFQLRAGLNVPVSDQMGVELGYRYLLLPTLEVNDGGDRLKVQSQDHIVTVGGRYHF
jgi:opacity protein-like surface antigen